MDAIAFFHSSATVFHSSGVWAVCAKLAAFVAVAIAS
jgi:hypothetical protein